MMWWLAGSVDRRTPHEHVAARPDRPDAAPDWFQVRCGRSGPASQVQQVSVPGCRLIVAGCCTTPVDELPATAERLARGDWRALAAVDGSRVVIAVRSDNAVVAGDLAGQCPVFFGAADDDVVVGSHAGMVARLVGGAVNDEWLATRLLMPVAADVWWTGSPWLGVSTLRPGWLLHIDRAGRQRPEQWLNSPVPSDDVVAAGFELRTALTRAVGARAHTAKSLSVDLSGGLDSSTVAGLAVVATNNPLKAVTLNVPGVDDLAAAMHAAQTMERISHSVLDVPDEVLPFSELEDVPLVDEPTRVLVSVAWTRWWRTRLAELGGDIHLSGDGADGVLLALPSYMADLATPQTMSALFRHARGWAHLRHQSALGLVRAARALKVTSYSDALRRAACRLILGEPSPVGWARLISWCDQTGVSAWATPQARKLASDSLLRHAEQHQMPVVPGDFGIGDATAWMSLNGYARDFRANVQLAADSNVALQSPFMDDGVVRACWSVCASGRTTPARVKPLLQEAVGGIIAPSVLARSTKGDYTSIIYEGLRRNIGELDDLMSSSRLAERELIDSQGVRAEMRKGAEGVPVRIAAFEQIVGSELWLRTLETQSNLDVDAEVNSAAILRP
jgi:asparagine synthase (glutamine-hydrolysing)